MSPTIKNSVDVDRISNLPDDLLCHILSFLPTKLSLTTTVLSKRWTPLCKLVTSLHFEEESVHDVKVFHGFCRFVDAVMLSTQLVKTIYIMCKFRTMPLPLSIFSFRTLVVLKLKRIKVVADISVDLPSVKTLYLIHIYFKNKDNLNKLLNGCPILENLQTHIYYIEQDLGHVRLKTLSNLITADIVAFDVPFRTIFNVQILKLQMKSRLSEVDSYCKDFPVFRNLINLSLYFCYFRHWDDVAEVFQYCPKLQILDIFKLAIDQHFPINWKYPNSVPECISSHLRSCTINYEGWNDELQFTKYILQNAQLLEVMKVYTGQFAYPNPLYPGPNRRPLEELTLCPILSPKCKLLIDS
ncbi:F-box/LRR-repeat protein [Trifolium pratense]|uniref:F-box/LRR-repeat protein n=1 Tax=Trifolium pratense TaxID=57577 RepID=A0A2K3NH96_TRIPR|nr:F-box/LRR-repeat protein [Trifolium pratense]